MLLLWPFGSMIYSLKNNKEVWAKNIFWIFCVFYGFTFVIYSPGVDAYRYAETFISWNKLSWTYSNFINTLYSEDTKFVDIFQPFLTFILSRFTSDTRILFAAFGFVFGFFYSRNLWYLFERLDDRKSLIMILFIMVFCLLIPIWRINAVRFWTAAHIFLYGTFPLLLQGDKKKLWISVLSVFVHFTFVSLVMVLILYLILGNRHKIYFFLFIISLIINELDLNYIKYQFESLPAIFQEKSSQYISDDAMTRQTEGASATNWYIRYYTPILKWIAYIFLISLYLKARNKIIENKSALNLFSFTLLFYAFANIFSLMPQGIRFSIVSAMLFFFTIIYFVSVIELPSIFKKLMLYSLPFILIIIIVAIRIGLAFTSITTIIGNPIIAFFVDMNISLLDYF